MNKWTLFFKIGTLIGLTLLMLIPVAMIMGVIEERQYYQHDVVNKITNRSGGQQIVAGPIIVQPYIKQVREVIDGKIVEHQISLQKYILPENLVIKGDLNVEKRKLGIYDTQIYQGEIVFEGKLPAINNDDLLADNITLKEPYLVVAVADSRGILNAPILQINQQQVVFEPGTNQSGIHGSATSEDTMVMTESVAEVYSSTPTVTETVISFDAGTGDSHFANGVHVFLPKSVTTTKKPIEFKFTIALQGSQSLSVIPVGRVSTFDLTTNWPHPNFMGAFLPVSKNISDKGFTASWKSSWFANTMNDKFSHNNAPSLTSLSGFNVNLIDLVDEYQLNERSVKYAVLFIGLTFIGFFLFEVMKGLRIHPIQYLLVGISLAMFYLILLALSEHIGFNLAYLIASIACSGLITFYLSAVLQGMTRGLTFGSGLLILYAILFGLLQSESNSLLLGSLVLFLVLALIMALTRHLDWYSFSQGHSFSQKPSLSQDLSGAGVTDTDEAKHNEIVDEIDRKNCRLWK